MNGVEALPSRLTYRLERESSAGAQAGCSITFSIFFGAIAAVLFFYAQRQQNGDDAGTASDAWILYGIGGFLALLALFLLYAGIHEIFALKTPETTVEMSDLKLTRGGDTRFFFRQPGPTSLISLRANLVGEETWVVKRGSDTRTSNESKYIGTFNFFDSGPHEIDANMPYEALITFHVPPDIPPSGKNEEGHQVSWKIEVWGKVRKRADFMHPYRIEVV